MTDTVTIKRTPVQQATFSAPRAPETTVRSATWHVASQEVVAFGSPSDAGEGGRLAVRENTEALRRLRDA